MSAVQPMGQKLHTNLIVVRLKLAKQQFEIAAYPNKVQEWRAGMYVPSPAPVSPTGSSPA